MDSNTILVEDLNISLTSMDRKKINKKTLALNCTDELNSYI